MGDHPFTTDAKTILTAWLIASTLYIVAIAYSTLEPLLLGILTHIVCVGLPIERLVRRRVPARAGYV